MAYYQKKGLTARKSEIIALTIQGVFNNAILRRLSISKATLRTHLNKIYIDILPALKDGDSRHHTSRTRSCQQTLMGL